MPSYRATQIQMSCGRSKGSLKARRSWSEKYFASVAALVNSYAIAVLIVMPTVGDARGGYADLADKSVKVRVDRTAVDSLQNVRTQLD
jgi:hypothetical protein